MAQYILAHDFGTSANKASLFTVEGKFVKTATADYITYHDQLSWAEQDAEDWWKAFCKSTKELMQGIDPKDVLCVSFDGTYPNCLCVDQQGKPLHRAMIWQDARAYKQAADITKKIPTKYTADKANHLMQTDRTLPKLLWIKENQPEIFEKTAMVLPCVSNYIIMKLTGNACCSYSIGKGTGMMNMESTDYADEILQAAGISREILPTLCERTNIVGEISEEFAGECGLAAGTKLVAGADDSSCTSIGAGISEAGDCYMNGGTSAGIVFKRKPGDASVGGQTASSGSSFRWLKNTICQYEQFLANSEGRSAYDLIDEELAEAPIGSHGVMFHPYLAGERQPRNNPRARGSFVGITLTTTRADILRSVIEGIGLNINLILQDARDKGYVVNSMPIVGGLGKSEFIRQIFADIMNVDLIAYEYMDEAATVGAAVLGGIALGLYEDESAVQKFMKVSSITKPIPENHEQYKKIMPLFEDVYNAMVPLYEKM